MESDPASVRTIAAAAFEILKDLDEHGPNTGTFYQHINPQLKPVYRQSVANIFRAPQKFLQARRWKSRQGSGIPLGVLRNVPSKRAVM
jgi:hypothetical protein